eukprot:scaffold4195_cov28-Tisochrysis_lutea.AAC.3
MVVENRQHKRREPIFVLVIEQPRMPFTYSHLVIEQSRSHFQVAILARAMERGASEPPGGFRLYIAAVGEEQLSDSGVAEAAG